MELVFELFLAILSTAMKTKRCQIKSIPFIYSQSLVLLYGISPRTEYFSFKNGTCNASMAAKHEFLWTLKFHFLAKQLQLITITKQDQEKVINPTSFITKKETVKLLQYRMYINKKKIMFTQDNKIGAKISPN